MVFGRQVGRENRAKIDQKTIQKGIGKMMKKRSVLMGSGEGGQGRAMARVAQTPPPFLHFQRTKQNRTKAQSTEVKKNTQARHARARWRIIIIYDMFEKELVVLF